LPVGILGIFLGLGVVGAASGYIKLKGQR
jgi:hypothetical protein